MAKKPDKEPVSYVIEKIYGYVGDDKIFVRVNWNDHGAKDELRKFWRDKETDEIKLGKGLAITEKEVDQLKDYYKQIPKPVDFEDIFTASEGLAERRLSGITTQDGYIVLKKKPGVK